MKILISILIALSLLLEPQNSKAQGCTVVSSNPPTVIYVGALTQWQNIITHVTNGCNFVFVAAVTGGTLQFTGVSTTTNGVSCTLATNLKSIECHGRPLINNLFVEAVMESNYVGQSFLTTNLNGAPEQFVVQTINYPYHIFLPEIQ